LNILVLKDVLLLCEPADLENVLLFGLQEVKGVLDIAIELFRWEGGLVHEFTGSFDNLEDVLSFGKKGVLRFPLEVRLHF